MACKLCQRLFSRRTETAPVLNTPVQPETPSWPLHVVPALRKRTAPPLSLQLERVAAEQRDAEIVKYSRANPAEWRNA